MFCNLIFLPALIAIVVADSNTDKFAKCCKDKNVNDDCTILACNYSNPTDLQLISKLFHHQRKNGVGEGDVCGPSDAEAIAACCQKGKDNRQCCTDAGVGTNFDYCINICNGVSPPPWDDKYFECEDMTPKVKECGKKS
uniref:Uncharacterized protein n=1 Tax=Panagrolaimus sp. ES5 TaxID=591445 RepID=A0AC34FNB5_9BILA